MVDYQAMGRRMRMKRRYLRLSQEDVAKKINVSTSFYGNVERGVRIPSVDTLVDIAIALGVTPDFLLEDSIGPAASHSPEELSTLTRYLRDRIAELDYSGVTDINREI